MLWNGLCKKDSMRNVAHSEAPLTEHDFLALARAVQGEIVSWRRRFHENPEPAFQERETSAFAEALLRGAGWAVRRIGETGLAATMTGGKPGKTIGLRADMDALPGDERTGLPYASKRPGFVHSCGHDAHTAILLGVASIWPRLAPSFPGTVKLFFQPAEEILAGAKTFVEAGELDGLGGVAALHVMTDLETGTVGTRRGVALAASDRFLITISGRSAHGAQPHRGVDAVVVAAQVITALQSLVSRTVAPLQSAVLTIGTVRGGSAANVIASEIQMEGTLRSLSQELRGELLERMEKIVRGTAESMGASGKLTLFEGTPALVCDDAWVARLEKAARGVLGEGCVRILPEPSMGGEDFAYMLQKAPGVFWRLGARKAGDAPTHSHSATFMIDEEALPCGVAVSCRLIADYLAGGE